MKRNFERTFIDGPFRHRSRQTIWAFFSGVVLHALLACSASASPVVIQITTDPTNQTINDPDHELGLAINHLDSIEIHITNPDVPFPTLRNPDATPYEAIIKARFNVQLENSESAEVVYQSTDPILLGGNGDTDTWLRFDGPLTPHVNHPDSGTLYYDFSFHADDIAMTAISAPPGVENHATLGFFSSLDVHPLTIADRPRLRSASDLFPLAPFGLNRFQGWRTWVLLKSAPGHTSAEIDMVPGISVPPRDVTLTVIPEPASLSPTLIAVISFVVARRKRPTVA